MKFKVRTGFMVHVVERKKVEGKILETSNSFHGDEEVDFDEATAKEHLHKLEPLDKKAADFAQKSHVSASSPTPAAPIDPAALQAAVADVLKSMGITPPKQA